MVMAVKQSLLCLLLVSLALSVSAQVPANKTFSRANTGSFGDYIVEYDANYRTVPLAAQTGNFQLVFFNTTPDNFELAIRMGSFQRAETMRFIWSANPAKPVGENATVTFGRDGNLVLLDANKRLVWSTNTANNGVVGIQLLNNGNMVLYDKNNHSVWQSFDFPTDTLLVGQSLRSDGVSMLVSRSNRSSLYQYILSIEIGGLVLYAMPKGSRQLPYWTLSFYDNTKFVRLFYLTRACKRPLYSATFISSSDPENGFVQQIELRLENTPVPANQTLAELCQFVSPDAETAVYNFNTPRFPTTLSFMRIDADGNVRFYTYSPEIEFNTWDVTYQRYGCGRINECGLPSKCGQLGLCGSSQCVACPQPSGLLGWSNKCSPPSLGKCGGAVTFYSVVGAEHYSLKYSDGMSGVKVEDCKASCAKDCKCAAYFYWKESSTCFMTPDVSTLSQSGNSSHLAFIKMPTST